MPEWKVLSKERNDGAAVLPYFLLDAPGEPKWIFELQNPVTFETRRVEGAGEHKVGDLIPDTDIGVREAHA